MPHSPSLDGIRVFELGTSVAAPYGAWILAQLGAEVIKVERPGEGDDARKWGPPFWHGAAAYFQALNRDKRSIAVDLKSDDERLRLRRLIIETADVVLQNYRPDLLATYGLSAEELLAENPRIVYCNIRAFGAAGPLRERRGYDPLMQACGGLMSVTGEGGDRPPVRVGTSIVDMGTGMWTTIGILSALRNREESGQGGIVDASLYETALGWMTYHAAHFDASGEIPWAAGSGVNAIVPYQAYPCSDGYLVVAAGSDSLFGRLSQALGCPDWPEDPRYRDNPARVTNRETLNQAIEDIMVKKPRAHWQEVLDGYSVPNAPIQHIGEVLEDAQTEALGIVQKAPDGSDMRLIGLPLAFDGERPLYRNVPPPLGEANDDIFKKEKG